MKTRNHDHFILMCNIDYWRKILDRPADGDDRAIARREYDKYVAQLVALELKKHRAASVRRERFLAKHELPKAA